MSRIHCHAPTVGARLATCATLWTRGDTLRTLASRFSAAVSRAVCLATLSRAVCGAAVSRDVCRAAPVMMMVGAGVLALAVESAAATPLGVIAVTSTADSGPGTLRQALLDANASSGGDIIEFNLAGCSPVCVIRPTVALPILTGGANHIDGYSQPGSMPPTATSPAVIRVAIDGSDVANNNGLSIVSPSNEVNGLAIYGFGWNGIGIGGPDAAYNSVWGNHIGLTAAGLGPSSRRANGFDGVFVGLGAYSNTIGGDLLTQRNVISGNGYDGVAVHGAETRFNHIAGNLIGTDASGEVAVPNSLDGVRLYGGARQSSVGVTDDLGQRNVISGNDRDGVRIAGGDTSANLDGNLIGTTYDGFAALGNAGDGVHILDGAGGVSIGAAETLSIGLISGNGGAGINLEGGQTLIFRQFIGVDASGRVALPNDVGIRIAAAHTGVGSSSPSIGNLISGNREAGVVLTGAAATSCSLYRNLIGMDVAGLLAVGNGGSGIEILDGAHDNTVGGQDAGNTISGNGSHGVLVNGASTIRNRVKNDSIYDNDGAGIWLENGANGGIAPPDLVTYVSTTRTVTGNGCPGCTVEIYSDDVDEGRQFLASGTIAADGKFLVDLPEEPAYAYLTATVTDTGRGTSQFSAPLSVAAPTPATSVATATTPGGATSPTPTPTSSATPTPTATSTGLASVTATATATATATDTATAGVGPSPSVTPSLSTTPDGRPTTAPSPAATTDATTGPTTRPTAAPTFTPGPTRTPTTSVTPGPVRTATPTSTGASSTPTAPLEGTRTPTATSGAGVGAYTVWLPIAERGDGP